MGGASTPTSGRKHLYTSTSSVHSAGTEYGYRQPYSRSLPSLRGGHIGDTILHTKQQLLQSFLRTARRLSSPLPGDQPGDSQSKPSKGVSDRKKQAKTKKKPKKKKKSTTDGGEDVTSSEAQDKDKEPRGDEEDDEGDDSGGGGDGQEEDGGDEDFDDDDNDGDDEVSSREGEHPEEVLVFDSDFVCHSLVWFFLFYT